jgi:hypothetical protein
LAHLGRLLSSLRERIVGGLAGLPPHSVVVGGSSIESSSRSKPAEQLGTHSGAGFCCRAELGSDGITALAGSLLSLCVSLLQALQSITSPSSIALRLTKFPLSIFLYPFGRHLAALRLSQSRLRRPAITLGHLGAVSAVCSLLGHQLASQIRQTQLLNHCPQSKDNGQPGPQRDHPHPRHHRTTSSACA